MRGDLERGTERLTAKHSSLEGDPQQEGLGLCPEPLRGALSCLQMSLLQVPMLHSLRSLRFLWVAPVPQGGVFLLTFKVHCSKPRYQALWEFSGVENKLRSRWQQPQNSTPSLRPVHLAPLQEIEKGLLSGQGSKQGQDRLGRKGLLAW